MRSRLSPGQPGTRWRCYRCGRGFAHARYLVTHLIDLHNEQPGGA